MQGRLLLHVPRLCAAPVEQTVRLRSSNRAVPQGPAGAAVAAATAVAAADTADTAPANTTANTDPDVQAVLRKSGQHCMHGQADLLPRSIQCLLQCTADDPGVVAETLPGRAHVLSVPRRGARWLRG